MWVARVRSTVVGGELQPAAPLSSVDTTTRCRELMHRAGVCVCVCIRGCGECVAGCALAYALLRVWAHKQLCASKSPTKAVRASEWLHYEL